MRTALVGENWKLFCALINPRAQQTDLLRRERLDAGPVVQGRHPVMVVLAPMRNSQYQRTSGAVTGDDDFAIPSALQCAVETVELQMAFWFFAAVALRAGVVENVSNVFCEGHIFLG